MQHRKLDRLMTPVERIARVAAAGLTSATSATTKPSGAKSYDNADGTRTIIGNVANGESNPSYTMATHVGDTTAPGTPTGVTASSKSGVVVVEWDGTLTGGVPDDFCCVRVYLDGSELGILTGAGSVSSASLEGGTTHGVTATAEDDACLPDGTPAHNVSAPTAAISVTVSEGVESVAAIAQEALDVAEATGQHFWSDTDGIHVTEVTQEEWQDSTGSGYHSGANVLINALGQLFRDGLTHLMALLPGQFHTETFTIDLDEFPSDVPHYTLAATPSRFPTVTVGGVVQDSDRFILDGNVLEFRAFYDYTAWDGLDMVVTYRGTPSLTLFDGLGNAAANVVASFESHRVSLAKGFDPAKDESGSVDFFDGEVSLSATRTSGSQAITLEALDEDGSNTSQGGIRVDNGDGGSIVRVYAHGGGDNWSGASYGEGGAQVSLTSSQYMNAFEVTATTLTMQPGMGRLRLDVDMVEAMHEFMTVIRNVTLSNITFQTAPILHLCRRGTTVSAIMNSVVNASSAGTRISVGTIPAGFRPPQIALQSGVCVSNNNFNGNYQWRIDTNGAVTYLTSVTGAREAPLVLTWQTTDAWPS